MSHLFDPLTLRDVTLRNRIGVSPMCQYSSQEGFANARHLAHPGARAVGSAGLMITEAAAVQAVGRITPWDLGIYCDEHIEGLRAITRFLTYSVSDPGTFCGRIAAQLCGNTPAVHAPATKLAPFAY